MNKKELEDLAISINKEYKGASLQVAGSSKALDIPRLSTGSLTYDICTGGGNPIGRHILYYGAESSGKAQPLSSKILTPYGWKSMSDMEVGSIISTPDGKNSTVIGVYPQGEQDVYEVTFDDKTKTKCTLDHLWFVESRDTSLGEVLTTKQLLKRELKTSVGTRKFKIPTIKPVEFEKSKKLPLNPYLLGCLIGDGGLTTRDVKITLSDKDVINRINEITEKEFENMDFRHGKLLSYSFRLKEGRGKNEIRDILEDLGIMGKYSYEKSIPEIYLRASIEDRLELLRGLMDTDGSCENGTLSYSTSSPQLSKDLQDLCRGLGMRCNTSSRITKYTNPVGKKVDGKRSYRSTLLMGAFKFSPFYSTIKSDRMIDREKDFSYRFIENIEKVGKEMCQCIAIGHPDKLYITDDFIVTHNTTVSILSLAEYQKSGDKRASLLIDSEYAFDKKYAENLGVDVNNLLVLQPDDLSEAHHVLMKLLEENKIGFFIIDSIASLLPKSILENEADASNIGKHAQAIGNMYKISNRFVGKNKVTAIWINQIRDSIGGYGGGISLPGGHAPKFYSSIMVQVMRGSKTDNKDGTFTNQGWIRVTKNKTFPPYKEGKYDMEHGTGISLAQEVRDWGIECGVLYKKGHSYYYDESFENDAEKNKDHVFLGRSKNDAKQFLEDNEELRDILKELILKMYLE